jgi:hypothetical protein
MKGILRAAAVAATTTFVSWAVRRWLDARGKPRSGDGQPATAVADAARAASS